MIRIIIGALAGAVALCAGAAPAQQRVNPYWKTPVDAELAGDLFPGFAAWVAQEGRVEVRCHVPADGRPYDCTVVEETPPGLGFGAAARVMLTSAEVATARIDGRPVPSVVTTTVRFWLPDRVGPGGSWTGPEPTPARLALARRVVAGPRKEGLPEMFDREQMLDGLDHDRRAVVRPWIDELFPPDPEAELKAAAVAMARLYSEADLRRILAGEPVDYPSEDEFFSAWPEATPQEEAKLEELRRRYCARYECGASAEG